MQKFIEDGVLKKVNLQTEITNYELNTDHSHQHFICTNCGLVESIEIMADKIIQNLPKSLKVEEVEMNIKGKCAKCI